MTKQTWIIANWKSNKTISEALEWLDEVGPKLPRRQNLKVVICPTFTDLEAVKKNILVNNYPVLLGAQDLSPFKDGPYTGEEPARILSELVDLVILGHSERRNNFHETDEMIAEKVQRAKEFNIIPLVCVQTADTPIPERVSLVAYEPLFAIGTGNPDTPINAAETAKLLQNTRDTLEVLYGGSVTAVNAKSFLDQDGLSGVLVGGASLSGEEFIKIVELSL